MRPLILMILLGLLLPASAGAVDLRNPDGSRAEPFQTWTEQSRVPTVNSTFTMGRDVSACRLPMLVWGCAGRGGLLVVTPNPEVNQRRVLMHELGHQFDFRMPEWKRDWLRRLVGLTLPWESAVPNQRSYSELFADLYSECARGRRPEVIIDDAYISRGNMGRVCRMIRS